VYALYTWYHMYSCRRFEFNITNPNLLEFKP